MIHIILVEPKEPGNIGAVARAMANFDVNKLILINPQCDHLCDEALNRAVHAKDILKNAKIDSFDNLIDFHTIIGTTSLLGNDYNISRIPMLPDELAKKINNKLKIGIVFGRESNGLTNKEVESCDFITTIPTSKKYPATNLSHSVSIILYELFKSSSNAIGQDIEPASVKDKELIETNFNIILDNTNFSTNDKKDTQKKVWKRIFSKAMLSKREAFAVIGLLKKLIKK